MRKEGVSSLGMRHRVGCNAISESLCCLNIFSADSCGIVIIKPLKTMLTFNVVIVLSQAGENIAFLGPDALLRGLFNNLKVTCKKFKFLIVTATGTYKKCFCSHAFNLLKSYNNQSKIYELINRIINYFVPNKNAAL